jgi:hypothetical protein
MNQKPKKIITISDLYKLFFNKKLVALSKFPENILNPENPMTPIKKKPKLESDISKLLSPDTKIIYNSLSPDAKIKYLELIKKDDAALLSSESKADESDPDYQEKMENNGLGFFMENFISMYYWCPVCQQKTLRKYSHSNIPVVDLVCINSEEHLKKNECFLFQVKISLTNDYFNINEQTISIGSKTYGEPAHLVKGTEPIKNKYVVPGYICIKLYPTDSNKQIYRINYKNSFVLIPDYDSQLSETYYHYLDKKSIYNKDIITWNNKMCKVLTLSKIPKELIEYELFDQMEIENPYLKLSNSIGLT